MRLREEFAIEYTYDSNAIEDSTFMTDFICDYLIEELNRYVGLREQG